MKPLDWDAPVTEVLTLIIELDQSDKAAQQVFTPQLTNPETTNYAIGSKRLNDTTVAIYNSSLLALML